MRAGAARAKAWECTWRRARGGGREAMGEGRGAGRAGSSVSAPVSRARRSDNQINRGVRPCPRGTSSSPPHNSGFM